MKSLIDATFDYALSILPPVTITYRRGETSATAAAIQTKSTFQTTDPQTGQWVTVTTTDWLVRLGDIGMTPEPFDVIESGGRRYQVNDPAMTDIHSGTGLARIHTRDIGAVA